MAENKYIGITLGPILATTGMASTPAGLWAASYMFSYLTRTICEKLTDIEGVDDEQIISPYFSKNEKKEMDGVGLFHDHIIVKANSSGRPDIKDAENAADAARKELKKLFEAKPDSRVDFSRVFDPGSVDALLKNYIRISIFSFDKPENETAIMSSQHMFDCIELAAPIMPPITENPLLSLFDSRESGSDVELRNTLIKASKLVGEETDSEWQLYDERKKIRSLSEIAAGERNDDKKVTRYYAILRSDGDSISKVIAACSDDKTNGKKTSREFSKLCLDYCKEAARLIKSYGGVTIYSGGDDLLAIVPVESSKKNPVGRYENIFDIVTRISKEFNRFFTGFVGDGISVPTISFGIAVCHKKYPLYESLKLSAEMLFGVAKLQPDKNDSNKYEKDFTAITFMKHSGQSETLLIKNTSMSAVTDLFDRIYSEGKKASDFLSSVNNKLMDFKDLFEIACQYGMPSINNIFLNTFDSEIHKENQLINTTCPELLYNICNETDRIYALKSGYERDDSIAAFDKLFRVIKFFGEKAGREAEE